jgi:hypothetical protein
MAIEWTKQKISDLGIDAIQSLKLNVKIKGRFDIAEICDEVLIEHAKVEPKGAPKTRKPLKLIKVRESNLCEKLIEVAAGLLEKYDLSTDTAKKLSQGTKRFRAHKLLSSSKGGAKTGAHQTKDQRVAFDRYISYRLGDYAYSLFCIQFDENDSSTLRFHVLGDPVHLTNFKSIYELRPYLTDADLMGANKGGEEFENFEQAVARYEWLISKVAPRLNLN